MVALTCLGAMTPCRIAELCVCCAIVIASVVLIAVVSAARPYAIIALFVTIVYALRLWRVLPYERHRAIVAKAVYARCLLEAGRVPPSAIALASAPRAAKPCAAPAAAPASARAAAAAAAASREQREPTYMPSREELAAATTPVFVRPDSARVPGAGAGAAVRAASARAPRASGSGVPSARPTRGGSLVGPIRTRACGPAAAESHAPFGCEDGAVPAQVRLAQSAAAPQRMPPPYARAPPSMGRGPSPLRAPSPMRGQPGVLPPPYCAVADRPMTPAAAASAVSRPAVYATTSGSCLPRPMPRAMPRAMPGPGYARPASGFRPPYQ